MRLERILCPVGLTENSAALLEYCFTVASRLGARVCVLHVTAKSVSPGTPASRVTPTNPDAWLRDACARATASLAVPAPAFDIAVRDGDVDEQIIATGREYAANVTVIGFRPGAPLGGSHHAERVAGHGAIPVLAIPAGLTHLSGPVTSAAPGPSAAPLGAWRTVLVATALRSQSPMTHEIAQACAQASGARLIVVHVSSGFPVIPAAPEAFLSPDFRDFALEEAARQLDAAFSPLPPATELFVGAGSVDDEIERIAEREAADLVVVGLRSGGRRLARTLAIRLLEHARCPVLLVPHAQHQARAA